MHPYPTNYVVTKPQKSVGIAILLALVLGPIGLFYASVTGGLVMLFGPIIALVVMIYGLVNDKEILWTSSLILILFLVLFWWLICMIWAVIGVNSYNSSIIREAEEENERYRQIFEEGSRPDSLRYAVHDLSNQTNKNISNQHKSGVTGTKPSLEEWSKSNPGKSINDYFRRFPD